MNKSQKTNDTRSELDASLELDAAEAPSPSPEVKSTPSTAFASTQKPGKFARFKQWFPRHKKTTILLAVLIIIGILAAIPTTRYAIAGLFWKQDYKVHVIDAQTKKPVSSATVKMGRVSATTDAQGAITFRHASGEATIEVSKKYYKSTQRDVLVPILKQKQAERIELVATGRQVPMSVVNKITQKAIANATLTAADTTVTTDDKGQATIVLPADKQTVAAKIIAEGFNDSETTVQVTSQVVKANTLSLTPKGKLHFLSNQSGKIDVVATNLDGTGRKTVVAGTGFESSSSTYLLASRDWKYLMLHSVRDNTGKPKMQVINAETGQLISFDSTTTKGEFTLIGWHDHHFLYAVYRGDVQPWEVGRQAIKSYNAETNSTATLDQSQGSGNSGLWAGQYLSNFYILPGKLVYTAMWSYSVAPHPTIDGKLSAIRNISPNGQDRKDLKTFDPIKVQDYVSARLYEPAELYLRITERQDDNKPIFYEYENGSVTLNTEATVESFNRDYPTFLLSPSGKQTFWSEFRDGKTNLRVGDNNAKNDKQVQIGDSSEYKSYGWYTDNYLLASKKGSELYIFAKDATTAPLKVTDYYKAQDSLDGYGYGYGGL